MSAAEFGDDNVTVVGVGDDAGIMAAASNSACSVDDAASGTTPLSFLVLLLTLKVVLFLETIFW